MSRPLSAHDLADRSISIPEGGDPAVQTAEARRPFADQQVHTQPGTRRGAQSGSVFLEYRDGGGLTGPPPWGVAARRRWSG